MANLTKAQKEYIIELLENGNELPLDLKHLLFPPERQEYELVYAGKDREEDILAETMGVPLQPIRSFGQDGKNWHNMLIFGDNLQAMKTLLRMKNEGRLVNEDGSRGVKLVYIDPPFATKREFRGASEERAYQDKIAGAAFIEFLRKRLVFIRELMTPDGSIYVHLDHKKGHYIKILLDEIFGESNYRNGIARIKCNPKNYTSRTFGNIHDFIYFYSRNSATVLNRIYLKRKLEEVLDDFPHIDEKTGKRYKTAPLHARGIRKGETGEPWRGIDPPPGNHWRYIHATLDALDEAGLVEWSSTGNPRKIIYEDDSKGYALQDIWKFKDPGELYSMYPTEKTEDLLDHIIRASSNEGDIVLDAFSGSGTTLAVSEKLNRRWIGIDCSKLAIYTNQKRLLGLHKRKEKNKELIKLKPFTIYNAGLYDFSRLKELNWKDWRFFALNLFECKDEPHKIKGVELDGYRRGDDALVFNHTLSGGVVLDYGFIDDIHSQIGNRLSSRFFIIAPAASVTFLEDYIDKGKTRYYILRIPYSIINELHSEDFESISQPVDELQVNETVESVGFDFIRQPKVDCDYKLMKGTDKKFSDAVVKIKTFKSVAMAKGASLKKNRETLSMVFVDYDYPHDPKRKGDDPAPPLEFDEVFYAKEIEAKKWQIRMAKDSIKSYVMLVYMDIYGNEYTEIKSIKDFKKKTVKKASTSKRKSK